MANISESGCADQDPLVSVIVPNYNHSRFLAERLSSIRNQTFKDYELIVLDDASSDESLSVISAELSDFSHQLIINERNSGSPCSQWLKGIQKARGRYVWIAESDDSCTPDFLDNMITLMNQGASLAYCRSKAINEQGNEINEDSIYWPDSIDSEQWKSAFEMENLRFCQRYLVNANVIPNASAVLFRLQSALSCLSIAPILQGLLFTGDWLFWIHYLANSSGRILFIPQDLSSFRTHSGTTRSSSTSAEKEALHIHEYCTAIDFIASHPIFEEQAGLKKRLLSSGWDWIYLEYLYRCKPNHLQRLTVQGLHGTLSTLMLSRLVLSSHLRKHYFPSASNRLNRILNWLETSEARIKALIKAALT
jgi:glycosyltransferase involved in cell wall biosynthesis